MKMEHLKNAIACITSSSSSFSTITAPPSLMAIPFFDIGGCLLLWQWQPLTSRNYGLKQSITANVSRLNNKGTKNINTENKMIKRVSPVAWKKQSTENLGKQKPMCWQRVMKCLQRPEKAVEVLKIFEEQLPNKQQEHTLRHRTRSLNQEEGRN